MPWRRLALGALAVLIIAAGLVVLVAPRIQDSKEAEQAREQALAEQELRRARIDQRARIGRGPAGDERALLSKAEREIGADAASRGVGVRRVDCAPARGGYDCLAVTSDIEPTATNKAGSVGVPFRAVLWVSRGRFAWCKVNPVPGERALPDPRTVAPLPRACRAPRRP